MKECLFIEYITNPVHVIKIITQNSYFLIASFEQIIRVKTIFLLKSKYSFTNLRFYLKLTCFIGRIRYNDIYENTFGILRRVSL